jgi:hypothetical protein
MLSSLYHAEVYPSISGMKFRENQLTLTSDLCYHLVEQLYGETDDVRAIGADQVELRSEKGIKACRKEC